MYRTIDAVFPNTYVFAMEHRRFDARRSANIILLATCRKERIAPEQWAVRAAEHQSSSYVTSDRMQRMVEDLLVEKPDMAQAPVFSDDVCADRNDALLAEIACHGLRNHENTSGTNGGRLPSPVLGP